MYYFRRVKKYRPQMVILLVFTLLLNIVATPLAAEGTDTGSATPASTPTDFTIDLENSTMEVNLRNKVTITLRDSAGTAVKADRNIDIYLQTDKLQYGGMFYEDVLDTSYYPGSALLTIPQGDDSLTVYYRPIGSTEDGNRADTITARGTFADPYTPVEHTVSVNVTPAQEVQSDLYISNSPSFTAGKAGKVDITLRNMDQYYNEVPTTPDGIIVNLATTSSVGKFYNDENKTTEINSVTIPAGETTASFYYYDEVASESDTELSLSTSEVSTSQLINVSAAAPAKIELKQRPHWYGEDAYAIDTIVEDEFGNNVIPGYYYPNMTLRLSSNKAGKFYEDYMLEIPVSQIAAGNYLYYKAEENGIHEITADLGTAEVSPATVEINHIKPNVDITTDVTNWKINQRGKVTLNLWEDEDHNTPYIVSDGSASMYVKVYSEYDGKLYTEQVGGNEFYYYEYYNDEYESYYYVPVPPGRSSVDVYFEPNETGEAWIEAELYLNGKSVSGDSYAIENVKPAKGVNVVFETNNYGELEFTAGEYKEVGLRLVDQYNNPITTSGDVTVTLRTDSETGKFYSATENPVELVGNQITLVNGVAKVKYMDTVSQEVFFEVEDSATTDGSYTWAFVQPKKSSSLKIEIIDDPIYNDYYNISNYESEEYSTTAVTENVVFPVRVSIVDNLGNPVPQSTPLTVELSTQDVDGVVNGKFYSESNMVNIISEVTIGEYGYSADEVLFFVADGIGDAEITATVLGLAEGKLAYTTHGPEKLFLYLEGDEYYENVLQPGDRERLYVVVTDVNGRPVSAADDVTVSLLSDNEDVAFYRYAEDFKTITTVVIPAGEFAARVYFDVVEGEFTLSAEGDVNGDATSETVDKTVTAVEQPYDGRWLDRGWNMISTPVKLGKPRLNDIIHAPDHSIYKSAGTEGPIADNSAEVIESAFWFDAEEQTWDKVMFVESTKTWVVDDNGTGLDSTDPEFELRPMEVVVLKLKGEAAALLYPLNTPSGGYTKQLVSGWNLIGPALDMSSEYGYEMPVTDVLKSVEGKYTQVVSPGMGDQYPWSYTASSNYSYAGEPVMTISEGYWVYMNAAGQLAGYSYTPIQKWHPDYYPTSDQRTVKGFNTGATIAPPDLPAQFYGTITGATKVAGKVEAVIDGKVVAAINYSDGKFGVTNPNGAKLVVSNLKNSGLTNIQFQVDGRLAKETITWSEVTGEITEFNLTVDQTAPPAFNYSSVAVVAANVVELSFNSNIVNNLADETALKSAITISTDGGATFNALGEEDSIEISNNKVIVTLKNELTSAPAQLKVNAKALRDVDGNLLLSDVTTAPFSADDQVIDECFIATAAYGTKFGPAVTLLRQFRDDVLMQSALGRKFVETYYKISPPIAQAIAENGFLKGLVRVVLTPVVALVYVVLHPATMVMALGAIAAFGVVVYRRRNRGALL